MTDYLPVHIEVRWDGSGEDYTGLDKPGVWHLEPMTDDWQLPVRRRCHRSYTIDHPCAQRPKQEKVTSRKATLVDVSRTQVPLAPEFPVTFQGIQGTTVRGPEHQAKGLTLDLYRPQTMQGEEYFQHLYMGLGRAQKLEWLLLRNFPQDDAGELDWSIFEKGPPDCHVEFLEALETRAKLTWPRLERAQRELGMPAWADVPACAPDPSRKGRFLYDPTKWERQAMESHAKSLSKRFRGKMTPPRPVHLQGSCLDTCSPHTKKRQDVAGVPEDGTPRKRNRNCHDPCVGRSAELESPDV